MREGLLVREPEEERLGEEVELRVPLVQALSVVRGGEGERVPLPHPEAVVVTLGEGEKEALRVPLRVPEGQGVGEGLGGSEGVG